MATVDPYGPAFQQLSQNLVNIFLQREQGARDQQRINILRQRERRLADATDLQNAVEGLSALLPYVKPGQTIAEQPFLHKHLGPMTDMDPTDPNGLGGMVLQEMTPEDMVADKYKQYIEDLDGDLLAQSMDRLHNLNTAGMGASSAELSAGRLLWETRARAMEEFQTSPEFLEDVARQQYGVEEKIPVLIDGVTYDLPTSEAANLGARLSMFSQEMGLNWANHRFDKSRWDDTMQMRYAHALRESGQAMGLNIGIGRASAIIEDYSAEDGRFRLEERAQGHAARVAGINSQLANLHEQRQIEVVRFPPNQDAIDEFDQRIRNLEEERQEELDNMMAVKLFTSAIDVNAAGEKSLAEIDPVFSAVQTNIQLLESLGVDADLDPEEAQKFIAERQALHGMPAFYQVDPFGPELLGRGPQLRNTRQLLRDRVVEAAEGYLNGNLDADDIDARFGNHLPTRDLVWQEIIERHNERKEREAQESGFNIQGGEPR